MHERIRLHVESIFEQAPQTRRALDLKEELIMNLCERFDDLLSQGKDDETAYNIVIQGIGDVDELIAGLREPGMWSEEAIQDERRKSAMLTTIAVGTYILSVIPVIIGGMLGNAFGGAAMTVGTVIMLIMIAAATCLLVYNGTSKPKYVKSDETMVEDFKKWSAERNNSKALRRSIHAIVWMLTVLTFLCLGFFWGLWHPGWLIFILAIVANEIIRLVMLYLER